jgi:hypothetical protein
MLHWELVPSDGGLTVARAAWTGIDDDHGCARMAVTGFAPLLQLCSRCVLAANLGPVPCRHAVRTGQLSKTFQFGGRFPAR